MNLIIALLLQDYAMSRCWDQPERADPAVVAAARSSTSFGARYAAALFELHQAAARRSGYEKAWTALAALPEPAKALAGSLRKALHCGDCQGGRVKCADCGGKGRRDLKCFKCGGEGRHKPEAGVVGDVDVTVKCRNCDGQKVFRNAGCSTCARSGQTACGSCLGSPWRERRCPAKDCRAGTTPCPACKGKGRIQPTCGVCAGEKRVGASGAAGKAVVTVKCRGCEGKGVAPMEQPCPGCAGRPEGLGRARCEACATSAGFALDLAAVFTREPCAPCEGKGWPQGERGAACAACFGLGVRLLPR